MKVDLESYYGLQNISSNPTWQIPKNHYTLMIFNTGINKQMLLIHLNLTKMVIVQYRLDGGFAS